MGHIGNMKNSPITKTIDWNGIPVTINSLYLGRVVAGQASDGNCVNQQNGICYRYATTYFCGISGRGSSSGAYVQNGYTSNSNLNLNSAIGGGSNWDCNKENYIISTFTSKKGIITFNYNLNSVITASSGTNAITTLIINGHKIIAETNRANHRGGQAKNLIGKYELKINKPTKIKVELYTHKAMRGSSTGKVSISYTQVINKPVTIQPTTFSQLIKKMFGSMINFFKSIGLI
ncbi:MAG: hypothetical protein GXO79_11495 [Chlorobi bacterium]|nr:hypothetical protein [Chlorobiota bacterium]